MDTITADQRFEKISLILPPAPKPMGVYKPFLVAGNLADASVEDDGVGVRSAMGMGSMPDNIPVGVDAGFELQS
jgi:hypothetical protein